MKLTIFTLLLFLTGCAATETRTDTIYDLEKKGDIAYTQKNWKDTEKYYTQLAEITPSNANIWFRLGNAYAHLKQPDKAIASYKEAVIRNPGFDKAWHNMGTQSLRKTTRLYIEMIKHLKPGSQIYKNALSTSNKLLRFMNENKIPINDEKLQNKQNPKAVEVENKAK